MISPFRNQLRRLRPSLERPIRSASIPWLLADRVLGRLLLSRMNMTSLEGSYSLVLSYGNGESVNGCLDARPWVTVFLPDRERLYGRLSSEDGRFAHKSKHTGFRYDGYTKTSIKTEILDQPVFLDSFDALIKFMNDPSSSVKQSLIDLL